MPRLGDSFAIHGPGIGNGYGGFTRPYILTGVSNTQFNGLSLPFDLSVLHGPTGLYFCGPLLTSIEGIDPTYGQVVVYAVPNTPSLLGVSFYQQVMLHVSLSTPPLWAQIVFMSRGGHGVIGT